MTSGYEFELAIAARKLIEDILHVNKGDEVLITADSGSDYRAIVATAQAAKLIGAKPLVLWYNMTSGVGMEAEKDLPVRSLRAALKNADVWLEFNKTWLLYSSIYEEVILNNKTKYLILVGMDADMMVRMIGRVDLKLLFEFQKKLANIVSRSKRFELFSSEGTNMTFENDSSRPILIEGEIFGPGDYALVGQVDWAPLEESINGIFVADVSAYPPFELGLLRKPIEIRIENGKIVSIRGGREAMVFKRWLEDLNDPNMYNVAHIAIGCNPNARPSGNILEDERIWGALDWGFGSQAPTFKGKFGLAKSHTDCVMLNTTLRADGATIIENGDFVHEDLKDLAKRIKGTLA
ncbi:MAG TPA: hypothetical protein VKU94_01380 [Geobacterales bacterium]|nr:hypothetical protein [Geobacterales bacterium]